MITYPRCLIQHLKKAVLYLNKHKQPIINALKYPYSNGKLEWNNNLFKVIKRVVFGFRTFRHLR
ncbi:transposase, partial [Enterococcus avium]|uniref:transposase n=1 Tax=Enterococcus avium TaxID=33945 RepID=UPI0039908828